MSVELEHSGYFAESACDHSTNVQHAAFKFTVQLPSPGETHDQESRYECCAQKTQAPAASSVNEGMSMSREARARLRQHEREVYKYYDDMGPGKGNCTWGVKFRR